MIASHYFNSSLQTVLDSHVSTVKNVARDISTRQMMMAQGHMIMLCVHQLIAAEVIIVVTKAIDSYK